MDKLRPCPFCGGAVTVYYSSLAKGFFFMHKRKDNGCILLTPATIMGKYENLAEAYEAWNRRASDA